MPTPTLPSPFLHKRGVTAKVLAYAGPSGELVIDTQENDLYVQTGSAGGVRMLKSASRVTAGSYGPASDATLTFSGSFTVPYITVNADGLVTGVATKTMVMPASGYILPTASADTLGGVKVGANLSISDGVLSAVNSQYTAASETPLAASGNGSVGTSVKYAREDHVHPAVTLSASDIPALDASKITTGTIDIARLPAAAIERLSVVTDATARKALTTASVQNGDTVKETSTGKMYRVVDDTKLSQDAGWEEYTVGSAASVPWSGVTGKPSSFTPASHTHGNITNAGAIGSTASLPIITGTDGVLQTGFFGTTAGTFCQGNDSRLSDTRNTTNSLVLKLKSGTTEGTDLYTFNGSAAKTLDIKQGSNITLTAAAGSLTIAAKDTTYSNFVKSGSGAAAGLVPAPSTTAGTTKYLREDGTWTVPPNDNTTYTFTAGTSTLAWNTEVTLATVGGLDIKAKLPANPNTNTDTLMIQNVSTTNATYPILLVATANATANQGAKTGIFGSGVKVNPSTSEVIATKFTGALTGNVTGNCSGSSGSCTGNAATATKFSANQSVALTGDVTGSASSQAGWSVATTLANSGVTAGNYGPSANASPAHSGTFSVPYITVDAKGRVTAASTKTITLPASGNTNWTTHLYAGGSGATANAATSNGGTYLVVCDNSTARNSIKITGSGSVSVASDANGVITITGTDNNTDTKAQVNVSTTNNTYPLAGVGTANATANVGANILYFSSKCLVNYSTGCITTPNVFGTAVAVAASDIALGSGCVFTKTISAATTFTFSGVPSGKAATFSLILTNGGAATVTWPSSVKWAGGSAPDLTASGVDVITFITGNGGTTWYGVASSIGAA